MKQVLVSTLLLLLFSRGDAQLRFGARLGYVEASQYWDYSSGWLLNLSHLNEDRVPIPGFKAGVNAEYDILKYCGIVAEINYVQKGSRFNIDEDVNLYPDGTGIIQEYTDYPIEYIEIPILIKLWVNVLRTRVYTLAGLRYDLLYSGDNFTVAIPESALEKNTLGYSLGLGIDFGELRNFPVNLELRYNPDRTVAFENEILLITNSTIDLSLGMTLFSR